MANIIQAYVKPISKQRLPLRLLQFFSARWVHTLILIAGITILSSCTPVSLPITPTENGTAGNILIFDFDDQPEGVPPEWQILFAPYDAGSQVPDVIKANVQNRHFLLENLGTWSGLYAMYLGDVASPDMQISMDVGTDEGNAIGVLLVCRYSEAGWYQFRVSAGGSAIHWVQPQGDSYDVKVLVEGPGVFLDDAAHRLTGVCQGNQLTLDVDGNRILSGEADFLPTGSFGFGVESASDPGNRKSFDNIQVEFLPATIKASPTPQVVPTVTMTQTLPTLAPTATATMITTLEPTQRPTPLAKGEGVLYATDFNDNDTTLENWHAFAYSPASQGIVTEGFEAFASNGYYRMRTAYPSLVDNLRIYSIYDQPLTSEDVALEMHANIPEGGAGYGLVCRYTDAGWYQFMVEPDGIWTIRLVHQDTNGAWHFNQVSSGRKWLGQVVDLAADCKGDQLSFAIDGEMVALLHDTSFPSGKVGLAGWRFDSPGEVGTIDSFTVTQAVWNESGLTGPAPTPAADGAIYSTQFDQLNDLAPYWMVLDSGVIGLAGSPKLFGGPGGDSAPHTYQYINDFDPGTDVRISADIRGFPNVARGLICRYSQDGWYQAHYFNDVAVNIAFVVLERVERNEQGLRQDTVLDITGVPIKRESQMILSCVGDQISVQMDGVNVLYAEDAAWQSGRYGLMFMSNPPGNVKNAFSSYKVQAVDSQAKNGDMVYQETSSSPTSLGWNWGLNSAYEGYSVKDDLVELKIADNWVILSDSFKASDVTLSLNAEFLGESHLQLNCRIGTPYRTSFQMNSNGGWGIFTQDQMIASGESSSIQSGQNSLTIQCVDNRLKFSVNGEVLADVVYPAGYQRSAGMFEVIMDVPSHIRFIDLKAQVLQPSGWLAIPSRSNTIRLPEYLPGQLLYQLQEGDFIRWGFEKRAWSLVSGSFPENEGSTIIISVEGKENAWLYQPWLGDTPVEVGMQVALTSRGGAAGLVCRYTDHGRYEFLIQPDGRWFIRRNSSYWYEPRAERITILAHGQTKDPLTGQNNIVATCVGNNLRFSLNGVELGSAQDYLYPEGQVGILFDTFIAGTFTDLTVKVAK